MRIVAGAWRGRTLVAPPGQGTRPTADRVRQALFDTLLHAAWGGLRILEDAVVLDVFAGTGALGLEALSRGAASACFIESNPMALRALRANIATCKADNRVNILAGDVLTLPFGPSAKKADLAAPDHRVNRSAVTHREIRSRYPPAHQHIDRSAMSATGNEPASLVFLDPPYGQDLVPRAMSRLSNDGRIRPDALIVAETGQEEKWVPEQPILAERQYGAARLVIYRLT